MKKFKKNNVTIYQDDALHFLSTQEDNSIDLIITDPAYSGMNNHLKLGKGRIVGDYKNSKNEKWFTEFTDSVENYSLFLEQCKRVLKDDSHIFIMFDSYSLITLAGVFREIFNLKNIITWDKVNIGMGHYFRRRSEFILFGCKGKKPVTSRRIPDIWEIPRIHKSQYPTEKPVKLFEAMIKSSKLDDEKKFKICDPFFGSGSSIIASLSNNCSFIGCDISEKAFKISKERINEFYKNGVQQKLGLDEKFWVN